MATEELDDSVEPARGGWGVKRRGALFADPTTTRGWGGAARGPPDFRRHHKRSRCHVETVPDGSTPLVARRGECRGGR